MAGTVCSGRRIAATQIVSKDLAEGAAWIARRFDMFWWPSMPISTQGLPDQTPTMFNILHSQCNDRGMRCAAGRLPKAYVKDNSLSANTQQNKETYKSRLRLSMSALSNSDDQALKTNSGIFQISVQQCEQCQMIKPCRPYPDMAFDG